MSTTVEILAATERRLNNSIETCAELRTQLAQAERERDAIIDFLIPFLPVGALPYQESALRVVRTAIGAIELKKDRQLDVARQSRARLVKLFNERGISARAWHAAARTWKP